MSVKISGAEFRADQSLCGWGKCQATAGARPLCVNHLREAWAIVQADLNAAQQRTAAQFDTGETAGQYRAVINIAIDSEAPSDEADAFKAAIFDAAHDFEPRTGWDFHMSAYE